MAKPKREPTPAQREALARATAARRRFCAEHVFGPWLACGCEQAIADHADGFFADGSCAFEFRTCRRCPARIARSARRLTLHLPRNWRWHDVWQQMFAALHAPPSR
ncbi:hypothetical protein ABZ357_35385 [Streptomyces sp. NPDC005917]|uniref:hypothetical protein n=1 Tax=unclassified Streptomyces TaxID=2593676 RepID=UPI0033E62846